MPLGLEILAQLGFARLGQPRRILDEKFQLLGQPAADDGIVLAEAHGLRLAGKQLLVDEIGYQPLSSAASGGLSHWLA